MIGKLKGKIDFIGEDKLIIDVAGVGYNVFASSKTLSSLNENQAVSLNIETIVREDHIHLYGFTGIAEQKWFTELCKVKGVGHKVSMKILGTLSINDIILAISSADKSYFSRVPGIGPKLALRIVSELKDSAKKVGSEFTIGNSITGQKNEKVEGSKVLMDAVSALENLGYKRAEIYKIVSDNVSQNPEVTLETLITESLRKVSK